MFKYIIITCFLLLLFQGCRSYADSLAKVNQKTTGLYLANAGVKRLPEELTKLKKLSVINLINNPIENWDSTALLLSNIQSLKALSLNENKNVDLEKVFIRLSKLDLVHIDLSGMDIDTLPEEILLLKSLKSIYLRDNPRLLAYDALQKLSKLKELEGINVANCNIKDTLPYTLLNLTKLESIALDGNFLDTIPNIGMLPNLNSINLSRNQFRTIPETLKNVRRRMNLYLTSNRIEHIPDWVLKKRYYSFEIGLNPLFNYEKSRIESEMHRAIYRYYDP